MRFRIYLLIFGVLLVASIRARGENLSAFPPQVELVEIRRLVDDCSPDHPRLLVNGETLCNLRASVANNPFHQQLADLVVQQAEQLLDELPVTRDVIGRRLLRTSRRCVSRVLTLALAFHLTGEQRFADRCRAELLAAARFTDWNPDHFLDVAEMTFALAIGYDWLFAELDESARQEIRAAIVTKGVGLQFADRDNWWIHVGNNWGQVCHSGMVAGALAVLEDEPDLAARTVHSAIHNIVPAMQQYAPHGCYPEGPQYWNYGTTYNSLLIANLESALGDEFGLSAAPGFSETGRFLALATGPTGQFFNYSDGSATRSVEPILLWFANRYARPEWLSGEHARWQQFFVETKENNSESLQFLPLALLWPARNEESPAGKVPLNWSSGASVPVAILRSSWQDKNATYVGVKGGSPSASHGHMDSGSFVLESDGIRWAIDLEPENYHTIESRGMNFWDRGQNSDRWKLLRLNNHGHNTLVIDNQLQNSSGIAPIIAFSDKPDWPFTIVDLTDAYRGQVKSAQRGVALLPSGQVIIRDELTGLKAGVMVRWGMVTRGEPVGLGTDRIVLNQENQTLALAAISTHRAAWQVIDISTPKNDFDSPNPGACLVALQTTAPSTGLLAIVVQVTPGTCTTPNIDSSTATPLLDWPPYRN